MQTNKKRVLSLFSGCGGMDLGFEGDFTVHEKSISKQYMNWAKNVNSQGWVTLDRTCFEIVFANDINKYAKIAWGKYFGKRNVPSDIYQLASIVDLVREWHNGNANIFPSNIDVVIGGFPCQDFSIAGKQRGFNSDKSHTGKKLTLHENPTIESRGKLYIWMKEVIEIIKPKMFFAENVKGLVSLADAKQVIQEDFGKIGNDGYIVVPARVLNAANYGVPQKRERVIFIGFLKSALKENVANILSQDMILPEYDPYPHVTHFDPQQINVDRENKKIFVTSGDVLEDLKEPEETVNDLSHSYYSKAKWMGTHCQGQTEISLDRTAPTIRSEHHGNIEYRRLSEEHGGKNFAELNRGLKERRLSLRECARIQTFPDDYEFVFSGKKEGGISASQGYKLVGNAVPPLLAYHLARRAESLWDIWFKES